MLKAPAPPAPRHARVQPRGGFSLVELMVTLTILGFALAASMPTIGSYLRNSQIRNAAESIASGLSKARSEAVQRNQTVTFSLVSTASGNPGLLDSSCALSATSASWVVSLDNPAGACNVAVSDTTAPRILAKFAQGDGAAKVAVAVMTDGCAGAEAANQIGFSGFGRVAVGGTPLHCIQITHTQAGDSRPLQVRIAAGGTVRTCDPAVTDANDPRKC